MARIDQNLLVIVKSLKQGWEIRIYCKCYKSVEFFACFAKLVKGIQMFPGYEKFSQNACRDFSVFSGVDPKFIRNTSDPMFFYKERANVSDKVVWCRNNMETMEIC